MRRPRATSSGHCSEARKAPPSWRTPTPRCKRRASASHPGSPQPSSPGAIEPSVVRARPTTCPPLEGAVAGGIGLRPLALGSQPPSPDEKLSNAPLYVVPDLSNALDPLPPRVFERPVVSLCPRNDGARTAASHRHENARLSGKVVRELPGHGVLEVHPQLAHGLEDRGMDPRARLRPRRDRPGLGWVGEPVEDRRCHLRTARVVDAGKEHGLHRSSSSPPGRSTTRSATKGSEGTSHRNVAVAAAAPRSCATTKPGTSTGRMPEKVSVAARARVTAGLANEVDDVNQ